MTILAFFTARHSDRVGGETLRRFSDPIISKTFPVTFTSILSRKVIFGRMRAVVERTIIATTWGERVILIRRHLCLLFCLGAISGIGMRRTAFCAARSRVQLTVWFPHGQGARIGSCTTWRSGKLLATAQN